MGPAVTCSTRWTYQYIPYICPLIFPPRRNVILHSKSVILLGLCLIFVSFSSLFLGDFLFLYLGYLHSKSAILFGFCLFLRGFSPLFLSGIKMKYSLKMENDVYTF